jgi:hypothetical protein
MLAQAEKYLIDAQPMIPLDTAAVNCVKKPYVKGMYPNPGTLHPWKFVYIERDPAKWDSNVDGLMSVKDPIVQSQLTAIMASQEQFKKSKAMAAE